MLGTPLIRFTVAAAAVVVGVVAVSMLTGRLERTGLAGRQRARGVTVVGSVLVAFSVLADALDLGSANGTFGALQIAGTVLGVVLVVGRHAIAGAQAVHGAAILVWAVGLSVALTVAPGEATAVDIVDVQLSPDRSVLDVEVPFQGGCADLDLRSRWRSDTLVVWLTQPSDTFECLGACLDESCTETVRFVLDEPIPPGTRIEISEGLGLNLRTAAAGFVALAGLAAGWWLWSRSTVEQTEGGPSRQAD